MMIPRGRSTYGHSVSCSRWRRLILATAAQPSIIANGTGQINLPQKHLSRWLIARNQPRVVPTSTYLTTMNFHLQISSKTGKRANSNARLKSIACLCLATLAHQSSTTWRLSFSGATWARINAPQMKSFTQKPLTWRFWKLFPISLALTPRNTSNTSQT